MTTAAAQTRKPFDVDIDITRWPDAKLDRLWECMVSAEQSTGRLTPWQDALLDAILAEIHRRGRLAEAA